VRVDGVVLLCRRLSLFLPLAQLGWSLDVWTEMVRPHPAPFTAPSDTTAEDKELWRMYMYRHDSRSAGELCSGASTHANLHGESNCGDCCGNAVRASSRC
jgi:hypothetical protein